MDSAIDLSYLFHRTKSVVCGYGQPKKDKKTGKMTSAKNPVITLCNSAEESIFVRKFAMDVSSELRRIQSLDRFYVAMDMGQSWRKQIYAEYKGNRTLDPLSTFNWKRFYEIQEYMMELMERQGATRLQKAGAEADDLLISLTRQNSRKGISTIIMTSDRDLYQGVSANQGEGAVVLINTNSLTRKLVFSPDFHQWIKENDQEDIFNMSIELSDCDIMMDLYKTHEHMELNPVQHVFAKILEGDGGDNVPSIHIWPKETGKKIGELARITPSITAKVWDKMRLFPNFDNAHPITDDNIFSTFHINLELAAKTKIDPSALKRRYIENRNLMELKESIMPSDINEYVAKQMENSSYITKFDMASLLKDSPWEKEVKVSLDLFKGLQMDDNDVIVTEKKTNELF